MPQKPILLTHFPPGRNMLYTGFMQGFLRTYADTNIQTPADAAVVIPTVLRPQLKPALESIFRQQFNGRIHILVGIDSPQGDLALLDEVCATRPPHCTVQVFWLGFSTSTRHGGLHRPGDGGALRCALTYLANSPFVAYLDDDNWWHPQHLVLMRNAIGEAEWGFALRWFVHPETRRPIAVDTWESVGPGQGIFNEQFGGFVDPSCLMINKLACPLAAPYWNFPLKGDPMSADRNVFNFLSKAHKNWKTSGKASVFYTLNANDGLHPLRVRIMGDAYTKAGELVEP
jgi:glycosyltransferase involved in cell wall biosynthesis